MTLLLVGTATAFNAGVILHKVREGRYADSLVDVGVNVMLSTLYAGTLGGMAIAMVASLIFSMYLWFYPVEVPERIRVNTYNFFVRVYAFVTRRTVSPMRA